MSSPTRAAAKKIVNNAINKVRKANAIARIKKVMNARQGASRAVGTAYNGEKFALSPVEITGRTVSFAIPYARFQVPAKLPAGFVSIEGRQLLSGQVVARVTKTGILGNIDGVKHWYVKTTAGFALIHAGGTVQITAPNTTGRVATQLDRIMPGILVSASHARVTKFDARLKVNRYINPERFAQSFSREISTSKGSISYEPELGVSRMTIRWKSPAMTLMVYMSGLIQVFGAAKPVNAQKVVAEIFNKTVAHADIFKRETYLNISGRRVVGGFAGTSYHAPSKNLKASRGASAKLNVRNPRVSGYNHTPGPGQYVRPGPNGVPRLYNVKGNMSLSATKIAKAYEKAGVNMPQYLKNMLGGAFVFYGASKGANRAANWNAKKNGHYVAPGPGKQPYFYKLPKDLKAGYVTARKRYNEAGVTMPAHVRQNIFGRNTNGSPASGGAAGGSNNHTVQNNKVNGKSYKKLTAAQLVAVARNLGNAGATNKMTKAVLFERIKGRATVKSVSPIRAANVTVNGRTYTFSNDPLNQRIIRNGRKRVFSTLDKAEREAIARAYLGNNYTTVKAKNWYNTMRGKKMFPNA
jgi:TATA-box binding protein (TBP) (component of TFIID and TFIIIB)